MADLDDVNDAIAENAAGPKRMQHIGGQEVEQHSIDDQIKAANHLAGQQAATRPGFGLRFQKITPTYD